MINRKENMQKEDFKKGQTVYLTVIPGSDLARLKGNDAIIPAIVSSVGRQYIHVRMPNDYTTRFDIKENFCQADISGTRDCDIHLSEEDAKRFIKIRKKKKVINDFFYWWRSIETLTWDEIDTIYEIVKDKG